MLDRNDLQMLSDLLDEKLDQKLDEKLDAFLADDRSCILVCEIDSEDRVK